MVDVQRAQRARRMWQLDESGQERGGVAAAAEGDA
jgi:hypothetical protein